MISQMSGAHLGIFQRYDPLYPTSQIVPRSSPLGPFRVSSARNGPSGEERGETDVFAG